jgi:hypothetical protein
MTLELKMLALSIVLGLVQIVLASHAASLQWNRAKAKWEKETEKWADCQRQSKDQNSTGRKSWSFLASCMTSG